MQPTRLIVLETEGWSGLDELSKAGLTQVLDSLSTGWVVLLRCMVQPWIEVFEQAIANAGPSATPSQAGKTAGHCATWWTSILTVLANV